MKKQLYLYAFILISSLTACTEDPCKSKNCENGICDSVSKNCNCSRGYEQDSFKICTVEWTKKFIGTYSVTDSCTGTHPGTHYYTLGITANSPSRLTINNLGNKGVDIIANNASSKIFVINDTLVGGTIFIGTGSLIEGDFIIDYVLNDSINGNGRDTCRAVLD